MSEWIENGYALLIKELNSWFEGFVRALPNLAVALLVGIFFVILARIVTRLTEKVCDRFVDSRPIVSLVSRTVHSLMLLLGLFVVLGVLDLEKTVTSLLAGAGVLGLVIGIAFQDFMSNFFAGILISFRRPFVDGDIVESNDMMGAVETINLRNTVVRNFDGQQVLIPNKLVIENVLVNYSRYGKRRINISVGVSYATDLAKAAKLALQAVGEQEGVLSEPRPEVHYEEFGASSINFVLRFWIEYPETNFFRAQSKAIEGIKKTFDANNITIPFPIRTLDFGIEGGKTLREMLGTQKPTEE